ncbi:hypothetical protein ACHAO9_007262 [Fusarium lateritium]
MPLLSLFSGKREVSPSGESSPKRAKIEDDPVDNKTNVHLPPPVSTATEKVEDPEDVKQTPEILDAPDATASPPREVLKYSTIKGLPNIKTEELDSLMKRLKEMACARDDNYVEMRADNNNFLQADEEELEEKLNDDNLNENLEDKDKQILEELRIRRELMGVLLPENSNLEEICQDLGVNTEGINWKEGLRLPHMKPEAPTAKPHQIAGANWICDTLNSPIRAAILADECGTGKTLQMGLALLIHYLRVKNGIQEGTFEPLDPNRKFKPSIIFCPSNLTIAHQILYDLRRWFGDFFRIRLCHGFRLCCEDEFVKPFILNNQKELQEWITKKAEAHEDPETLRSIVIVTYRTAIHRMTLSDRTLWLQRNGFDPAVVGDQNGTHNRTRGRPALPKYKKSNQKDVVLKIKNAKFNWVMCDEGHAARNPRTTTHKLIKLLDREGTLIVSSTPLLNHQRDFWGYVNLFWRRGWPFTFEVNAIDPQVYYKEEAWNAMKEDQEFDGLTMGHVLSPQGEASHELSLMEQRIRAEFVSFITNKEGPLFLLNPDLYDAFRESLGQVDSQISQQAIKPLLKMFCIRRRMLTELTLPDGSVAMPSDDIRPMWLRVVRTQPSGEYRTKLREVMNRHLSDLLTNTGGTADEHLGYGTIDKGTSVLMSTAVFRTLSVVTTAPQAYPLTQPEQLDAAGRNRGPPQADSERVNDIIREDRTRSDGIQWYYNKTRGGGEFKFPQSKEELVMSICEGSPKLCWTVHRILELREQDKRVLIYVNHPLTSMILTGLLKTIDIETECIRTSQTQAERGLAAFEFNSPSSDTEVLVTSFQLSGFGINLHGASHSGIILEYPHNIQTLSNAFVYLENSFDSWIETNMSLKYANILAAEGEIHPLIKGEFRTICGFELIKMHLGQNCNRYPRVRATWAERDEDSVTREGHFYSAVAQYLMENPTHCHKFPQNDLSEVAIRWTPELAEITLDMIEGRAPVLEDGVRLDSRNPNNLQPAADASVENPSAAAVPVADNGWEKQRLERERARRI